MRRMRGSIVALAKVALLLSLIVSLAIPRDAAAADVRGGESVTIADGESIDEDLYVATGKLTVAGTAGRDVLVTGGEVIVPGRIAGNLSAGAGEVVVSGSVGRSVRVFGGKVTITGTVAGDVLVFGGSVTLSSRAAVEGDLLMAGGELEVAGAVGGDIRGGTGELKLDGMVGGDVRITVDKLTLGPDARIDGQLRYGSDNPAEIDPAAVVTGRIERTSPRSFSGLSDVSAVLGSWVLRLVWLLVAGTVIILLAPRMAVAVAERARDRFLVSLVVGLILAILIPIGLTLLLVSGIGLAIGLIGFALFFIVVYLSQVFVGLFLGRLVLPGRWDNAGRGYNLLAMALGVMALSAVHFIPLPFIAPAVAVITGVIGLGAVMRALRGGQRASFAG